NKTLNIESTKFRLATIEIFDLNGRKLLEKHFSKSTKEIEIDVSHLPSGVYFCRLNTENKSVTKKLIIK
ncbi:MAG: T9SS type A sorting domain-containing protein, partial [Bacteroidales bacterium]|nr:T9SS type A sorting domain-containing protein [Bacteroidales bacterium]